jgi:indole-3-glycerol phosphate synthase
MLLDTIMTHKRAELAHAKRAVPLVELKSRARDRPPALDFGGALAAPGVRLVAEVKRASPSKGVFCPNLNPEQTAVTYAANGASAISVLTDAKFFQGRLDDLSRIKSMLSSPESATPILRKDFIFDGYQVYESFAYGADALLLIVAVLSDDTLCELLTLTQDLGMTALVEVHNEAEIERALRGRPRVVGINNRHLGDFSVDLSTFGRLHPLLPDDTITVAESGVRTATDVRLLARMGADAVLVGEALVTAPDMAAKVRELANAGKAKARQPVTEMEEP